MAILPASSVFSISARLTAGLKFAPQTGPSAKIPTMREDAIARPAVTPFPKRTLHPTVRTRMYVPINSPTTWAVVAPAIVAAD
jgi:hypothetical protein